MAGGFLFGVRDNMAISVSLSPDSGHVCEPAVQHMSVDDAAYKVVHGAPGGAAALAARLGMSVQVLRNKANPDLATHVFRPQELLDIQQLSGLHHVLHSMADALGYTCVRATPDQSAGDPQDALMRLAAQYADLLHAYVDAVQAGPGGVTRNMQRRAEHQAQEAIAAINHLTATLRARMRPAPGEGD